jgi:four helix bundle protein
MSRDHRKLRVFSLVDELIVQVYKASRRFPVEERYGLQAQLRRAAVSTATNIVEGSARRTTKEYLHFLNVAIGSAAEAQYLIGLSGRLALMDGAECARLCLGYDDALKGLKALANAISAMG